MRDQLCKRLGCVLLAGLLAACGNLSPATSPTPAVTLPSTLTPIPPTGTANPTVVPSPTATPQATVTTTEEAATAVEGLRFLYEEDGNIFIEDSGADPIQLTNSGRDHNAKFTSDGKKIIYFRGSFNENNEVWMINNDGSGEQPFLTGPILANLELGYDETTEVHQRYLLRGSHKILFNTDSFVYTGGINHIESVQLNNDLLLADMDTGDVRRLLEPEYGGYFAVSPDQQKIAIKLKGRIDIVDIQGHTIKRNFIYYPYPEGSSIFSISLLWTDDSQRLIALLPVNEADYLSSGERYERDVWVNSLNGKPPIRIYLHPPPVGIPYEISPDGNWIAYEYNLGGKALGVEGNYLGNLQEKSTKLLGRYEQYGFTTFFWSPDSRHYILQDERNDLFLGDLNGNLIPLDASGFLGWLDASHYFYTDIHDGNIYEGEIGNGSKVKIGQLPPGANPYSQDGFDFILIDK